MTELFAYVTDALVGAILYILTAKVFWDEKTYWDINTLKTVLRRLITAVLLGYIAYIFNYPNHAVAIFLGYSGIDIVESIMTKLANTYLSQTQNGGGK
jgi:DMSO reductase anchor subunit